MRKTFISFVRITLCMVLFSSICIAQLKDAPYPIGKTFEQSPDGVWASLFDWTLVKKGNLVYGLMALGADRCVRATISGNNLASLDQAKKMIAVRDRQNGEVIDYDFEDIPPAEK